MVLNDFSFVVVVVQSKAKISPQRVTNLHLCLWPSTTKVKKMIQNRLAEVTCRALVT